MTPARPDRPPPVSILTRLFRNASALHGTDAELRGLYLDLMQRILINTIYEDPSLSLHKPEDNPRELGLDWPSQAHSMIGRARMGNLRTLCEDVLARRVPGDFIETGVWRGGSCIFMRALLKAHGVTDRLVWVADSFQGLPPPDPGRYPADAGAIFHQCDVLSVPLEQVQANFAKYDLLDSQVRFLKGWFKDTLPGAPISRLAILRLDGDMYESTMDCLKALYHKLSPGGYVIVDDHSIDSCRAAIDDFRSSRRISDGIVDIDGTGAYWRKAG